MEHETQALLYKVVLTAQVEHWFAVWQVLHEATEQATQLLL
jgi:hypothetical protein